MTEHNFGPVFDENSKILILGSFPSVKSREQQFFYANLQNRFWAVISSVYSKPLPHTVFDKRRLLLSCGVALWDVIAACEIDGSSDSSIKNAVPNDISPLIKPGITRIFTNGKTAYTLYNKLILPKTGIEAVYLPSTSPANAAYSLQRLCDEWGAALLGKQPF